MSERLQARSLLNGREGELPKVLGAEESFYIQIQRREGDGDTQHVAIGAGAGARGVRDRVRAITTGRAPRCGYTPFARAVRRESTSARARAFLSASLSSRLLILDTTFQFLADFERSILKNLKVRCLSKSNLQNQP